MFRTLRPFWSDAQLLAVSKPAGLLCVPDNTGDVSLVELMGNWLRHATTGAGYVESVHRIDRPVSGVVVLARTTKAAQRLGRAFATGRARKLYVARTEPLGADAPLRAHSRGEAVVWMAHARGAVRASATRFDGARPARTRWAVRAWLPDGSAALELEPEGGKRHQLRAAAAVALSAPLLGDVRYGAARPTIEGGAGDGWIALHAHALALPHPTATSDVELHARATRDTGGLLAVNDGAARWCAAADAADGAELASARAAGWLCLRAPPPSWWPLPCVGCADGCAAAVRGLCSNTPDSPNAPDSAEDGA
ncbi:hypothetical protein KFE25_002638 [Diacronema lutheri]|uniref:Pseudouridine synthase RsuA/RluA-like domain-containing protein n=1 Tax=Diacronema lutheri TaxID=2081491 RepID=A0A8J5XHH4_DIALT|nr:hypothetical protein KFE25_002638 [Diacronema lutheri]